MEPTRIAVERFTFYSQVTGTVEDPEGQKVALKGIGALFQLPSDHPFIFGEHVVITIERKIPCPPSPATTQTT